MRVWPDPSRPGFVYRMYDVAGRLLYVGASTNPAQRIRAHHGKEWWPEVSQTTLESFPTIEQALWAERVVIRAEHPTHNIVRYEPRGGPLGSPVQIRIPADTIDVVDRIATDSDTTRSDVVRTLIDEALMYRARKAARRAQR